MFKYFVCSDIHSFYTEWMSSLTEKGFDISNKSQFIVICGDLFDRGRESEACFNFVKQMSAEHRLVYVRGNHEDLMFDLAYDFKHGLNIGSHHISNGTVRTIADLVHGTDYGVLCGLTNKSETDKIFDSLCNFINSVCVNYAEIDDYIFVHGWIPTYQHLDDFRNGSNGDWERARWENGMERWKNTSCRVPGKTIVCGHWNCSWGWSHIRQKRKEWPQKNREDFKKSFEPFIDDGIIAIDACTAYTGIVNCIVIDSDKNICK